MTLEVKPEALGGWLTMNVIPWLQAKRTSVLIGSTVVIAATSTAIAVTVLTGDDSPPQEATGATTSQASRDQQSQEFPDESTTGVPDGTQLKPFSGEWTIEEAGTVIDGYDVDGIILVRANDVVIKNSRIRGSSWWSINITEGLTGVVVQDCDIDGQGTTGRGIMGPVKALRNDIRNVADGVFPGSGSLLQDNYIHDLAAQGDDPHYDGIQINGDCENVTMLHNTVLNPHDQTSAVIIGNYFGPVDNIRVEDNYLVGGGYTVYSVVKPEGSGDISGVSFINNTLGRGHWGYASFKGNTPVSRGNTDAETGEAVPLIDGQ